MRTFIAEVVADLYGRYGEGISDLNIVLPSRRARLFFVDALSGVANRPLWQPRFVEMDAIMRDVSGLDTCDHLRLITELYRVYSRYHEENFDSFYFWGDMLLSDFDSIDKYMVDARMLFANIDDLRAIEDDYSFLTPEQVETIRRFWRNFGLDGKFSGEKEHFINIWRSLGDIYADFRLSLEEEGIAYTGMMYRAAAERLATGEREGLDAEGGKYVFAGFNALSECEKKLLKHLQNSGSAEFYWDYDNYYVGNEWHEAGMFLRENIRSFPALHGNDFHSSFEGEKEIKIVSCASDSLQCKYVYDFLKGLTDKGVTIDKRTAIVLTDESLLLPVLHSIPESVGQVNVTMGYPLRQTTAYSFVERLIELQNRKRLRGGRLQFYHSDATGILDHPYILEYWSGHATAASAEVRRRSMVFVDRERAAGGIPLLERIFSDAADQGGVTEYIIDILSGIGAMPSEREDTARRREYFSTIIEHLIKLGNSLRMCGLELSPQVYVSLLRRTLQDVRIPYEGEPLAGLQIMGILETRNLDFENLLVLSLNDDTFPGNRSVGSSFIPYNLRTAYGLPTPLHHEGVYGYYFYRLLQRAGCVHLAYCSRNDERRSGEQSRYLYQLRYESGKNISLRNLSLGVYSPQDNVLEVVKSGVVKEKLEEYLSGGKMLSPTALYSYVECPMKYYFRYVASLKPSDEVLEEVDIPMFGTILHKAMETLYAPLLDLPDQRTAITALVGSDKVAEAVTGAINTEFLRKEGADVDEYGGNLLMIRDIVIRYINRCILPFDAAREGVRIEKLEHRIAAPIKFRVGAEANPATSNSATPAALGPATHEILLGGIADRIDRAGDHLRVVDYKTGVSKLQFAGIEELFGEKQAEHNSAVLQTLIYSLVLNLAEGIDVQPSLYYIRQMNAPGYSPLLVEGNEPIVSILPYKERLTGALSGALSTLFDASTPFRRCADVKTCSYCDFRELCRR